MNHFSRKWIVPLAICASALQGCSQDRSPCLGISGEDRIPIPRTILARGDLLAETRIMVREGNVYVRPACESLLDSADVALDASLPTVMDKERVPPSGNKHDFMSMAPVH